MSPGKKKDKGAKKPSRPPEGSGPDGRIELSDLSDKLAEIRGDVEETAQGAKPVLTYVAVGAAVAVVAVAFILGKRAGKRKTTWVEIKRK